jgi:hypothetical protein
MSVKSVRRGRGTSKVEVSNITREGFWLLIARRELFVSFADFPWFRVASIQQVLNVELPQPGHLYWPELDVDLAVESIEHPERFPLVSKVRPNNTLHPAAGVGQAETPARKRARRG